VRWIVREFNPLCLWPLRRTVHPCPGQWNHVVNIQPGGIRMDVTRIGRYPPPMNHTTTISAPHGSDGGLKSQDLVPSVLTIRIGIDPAAKVGPIVFLRLGVIP